MNRSRRVLLLGLLVMQSVLAIDSEPPLPDPERQALYENLLSEVRCLVCQNQAIGDSTAPLAADLRREIRAMVEEGKSAGEIKEFLTARYGDFVLYRPRFAGRTMFLWLAPGALVLLGGLALWRVLRRRASLPVGSEEEDAADA